MNNNTANTSIEQTAGFDKVYYNFYCLYSPLFENRPQLVDDFEMPDKHIDLLFYIIPLHRYCIIEIKITEFDFSDIGQLAGYTVMVDDHLLNTPQDNPLHRLAYLQREEQWVGTLRPLACQCSHRHIQIRIVSAVPSRRVAGQTAN